MDRDAIVESVISQVVFERTGKPVSEETKEYSRLQKEYEERFGEKFGFSVVGHEERSHIEVLRECLRTGKPYDSGEEYDPDVKY